MTRLEQIKNEVAREYGYNDWEDRGNYIIKFAEHDATWEDVACRYATEMVRHNLERAAAAAQADLFYDCTVVDKKSITSLEIELI